VIPVVLQREDANSETALLVEWLVDDRAQVERSQPICVVETAKAAIEIEAPEAGVLVHLCGAGTEVAIGEEIGAIAADEAEAAGMRPETTSSRPLAAPAGRITRAAAALAERLGVDLASLDGRGFVTEADVAALAARTAGAGARADLATQVATLAADGVTLPAMLDDSSERGAVGAALLELIRTSPDEFRAWPSERKIAAYREHGAVVGEGVELGEGTLIAASRIRIADGVVIGAGATVECAGEIAIGPLTHLGPGLEVRCRRVVIGENVHGGRSIRVGGGGHHDPWALLAVGDLAFIGDEVFLNPCRPVLIGREAFVTMRAMVVTHNVGHSVIDGYENRFAPVVVEDLAQVGMATIVYAGCRVGRGAIVGSNSYVVADVPADRFAIGVPARVTGHARRERSAGEQARIAERLVAELEELLALRGHAVSRLPEPAVGFELEAAEGRGTILFVERLGADDPLPAAAGELVVLTLRLDPRDLPARCAVLDLRERTLHGAGEVVLDSVREFCRKRGMRFAPGPWRYRGGLI
jgi:acetyltransferase-like isoleucine patch superfamily enzyme